MVLAVAAFFMASGIARSRKIVWGGVCACSLGAMLLWPLMRFFPIASIEVLEDSEPIANCVMVGLTRGSHPTPWFAARFLKAGAAQVACSMRELDAILSP